MIHLIDKNIVVAEINRVLNSYDPNEITSGRYALVKLRNFLDAIKVKDVDLEKELDFVKDAYYYFTSDERSSMKKVAKHFFELGLKAQKGEYV